jgi:hypothetical protein
MNLWWWEERVTVLERSHDGRGAGARRRGHRRYEEGRGRRNQ